MPQTPTPISKNQSVNSHRTSHIISNLETPQKTEPTIMQSKDCMTKNNNFIWQIDQHFQL